MIEAGELMSGYLAFIVFITVAVGLYWADKQKLIDLGRWNNILTLALGLLAASFLVFPLITPSSPITPTAETPITGQNTITLVEDVNVVTGQIRWNEKPLESISVVLFHGVCGENPIAQTVTDSLGYYRFGNLDAGLYALGVNGFTGDALHISTESNTRYVIACSSQPFTLQANGTAGDDFDLERTDLVLLSPTESFNSERPTFVWERYLGASYYEVDIVQWTGSEGKTILTERTIYTELTLSLPLEENVKYSAKITAFNQNGIRIAQQNTFEFFVSRLQD